WFEIPATNIDRAKKFYEEIFQVELVFMDMGDDFKMAVFPGDQESVSGAVIYNNAWYTPSKTDGPLVYLNGNPDLKTIENRIEAAGGKVSISKRQISPDHGYMAVFIDSEGNRVALHSNN
ncbi:MAG: VOC family protein, partial [Balneolales bacterium]|nr:VOC family protein [Balneolales bacterium]